MKTILSGLSAVLLLASFLIATIQAENMALSPSAAESLSLVNLTASSPANDQNPAWSPNAERIVFTSGRGGNNKLWLMDDDGSDPAALTSSGAENVNLPGRAWCSGNDRIVFASDVESVNDEVFSIASDGTAVQRVTETDSLNWEPSWSPDCSQIVFQSDRSGNWDIWRMMADGSSPVQLTDHSADDWEPNWSPDGATIVFQSDRSGNWDIWTMDVNGGALANVTNDPAEDTDPSWSPDGTRIVYSSDRGADDAASLTDDGSIWAIEASGGAPIQITNDPAYDGAPSWSPDGNLIAFESARSGNLDIWVVDAPVAPSPTPTAAPTPTNPACDLDGDLDGDDDVDIADIMLVANRWHTAEGDPGFNPDYDLDGNGVIDIVDIMLVAVRWGETCE